MPLQGEMVLCCTLRYGVFMRFYLELKLPYDWRTSASYRSGSGVRFPTVQWVAEMTGLGSEEMTS